jgi:hypothetical protein
MSKNRGTAARDYVERVRKHFKEPMEWREAATRYSTYLTAKMADARKSPDAKTPPKPAPRE